MNFHAMLHPYIAGTTPAAIATILSASTVLVIAFIVSRFMRHMHASARYQLLLGSLVAFAFPLPLLFVIVVANRDLVLPLFSANNPTAAATTTFVLSTTGAVSTAAPVDWQCPLFAILAAGAAILLVRSARRSMLARRHFANVASPAPPAAAALVDELRLRMPIREPIPLFVTDCISSPAVVGIRDPFIIIPAHALEALTPVGLRTVLAHELAHVSRRDNLASVFDSLVAAVFWFNPFVWLVRRELTLERERACDHTAAADAEERTLFLDALLTLCRATTRDHRPGLSCINSSNIKERVDYIMRTDQISGSRLSRVTAFATTFFIAAAAVAGAAFVTEKPLFAGEQTQPYYITTRTSTLADKRVQVDVEITDASTKKLVASPRIIAAEGESSKAGISYLDHGVERTFDIELSFTHANGGNVRVRVLENSVAIQDVSAVFMTTIKPEKAADAPVSLRLIDADVHDVIRTFSLLTGRTFVVDPALHGKVTIDEKGRPWTDVLREVARQIGASVREENNTIYVESPAKKLQKDAASGSAAGAAGSTILLVEAHAVDTAARQTTAVAVSDGMTPPVLVKRVDPMYTKEAKEARVAGMCIVAVEIDERGNVAATRVLKPMPFGLSEAAETAVKQWKFTPATKDGQPIRVKMNLTINFRPE